MRLYIHLLCLLGGSVPALGEAPETRDRATRPLIDLTDAAAIRARRPLLIAHRGGVITSETPECSLAAIRAAAHHRYDMVELDIQRAADGVPIVFHDRTLGNACGIEKRVADLTASQLRGIKYLRTDQKVCGLDEAAALCKQLSLGVMLDVKTRSGDAFFAHIVTSIRKHGLAGATVCINGDPTIQNNLKDIAILRITRDKLDRLERGEQDSLEGYFWFGLPRDLPEKLVGAMQRAGALVVPGINTFRYDRSRHRALARRDIAHLTELGVDGFQIDSAYQDFFDRPQVRE